MDSLITAAARALAAGDPLTALQQVALRDDPPALALRGIAMAQLGDHDRARGLLRRAARGFGDREPVAHDRCVVAEAEIALAARDLGWPPRRLEAAARGLEARGDRGNALQARLVAIRRLLLLGRLDDAEAALAVVDDAGAPPPLAARAELTRAEIALRRVRAASAAAALTRARAAAISARIPALIAEVERTRRALDAPCATLIRGGVARPVRLDEVEALRTAPDLVVDGCRRTVHGPTDPADPTGTAGPARLARRPVLFALVRALAEAWPAPIARDALIERAFATRTANASHRARLRVEIGRLRVALRGMARIEATATGFALAPVATSVAVLAPPHDGPAGAIVALLDGGEPWSTSALATALGASQRTVQRSLRELEASLVVRSVGRGRAQRWLGQSPGGFATTLLLPGAPATG